jgi:dTDP-4-dehydrorhamnose 3,5-epimerase
MKVSATPLPGVLLIEPDVHRDERGYFLETFSADRYAAAGVAGPFVQDNLSYSRIGVLRGLHVQHPNGQAKLGWVIRGEVFDVAVDVRVGSPTFGQWYGDHLSAENGRQLYLPSGFAHGFVVLSEDALFAYKCTAYYDRSSERTIRWDDPAIGIRWPIVPKQLTPRDRDASTLESLRPSLPTFG